MTAPTARPQPSIIDEGMAQGYIELAKGYEMQARMYERDEDLPEEFRIARCRDLRKLRDQAMDYARHYLPRPNLFIPEAPNV